MDEAARNAIKKALRDLERRSDKPRSSSRFPTSSIVFGLGLGIADFLLFDFVPRAWSTLLTGGLEEAVQLSGNASVIWQLSILVNRHQALLPISILIMSSLLFMLAWRSRLLRFLSWLAAVAALILNAWIIASVLYASFQSSTEAAGIDQHFSI